MHWSLVLWDLTNIYDTIKIAVLVRQALERRFPPAPLFMLIATYQAPRALKQRSSFNEWTSPHMSVLAGCGMANEMARCAVLDLFARVTESSPLAQLSQYVDDFTQYAAHSSKRFLSNVT